MSYVWNMLEDRLSVERERGRVVKHLVTKSTERYSLPMKFG